MILWMVRSRAPGIWSVSCAPSSFPLLFAAAEIVKEFCLPFPLLQSAPVFPWVFRLCFVSMFWVPCPSFGLFGSFSLSFPQFFFSLSAWLFRVPSFFVSAPCVIRLPLVLLWFCFGSSSSPVVPLFSRFFYGFCSSSLLWFSVPQIPHWFCFSPLIFGSPLFLFFSLSPAFEKMVMLTLVLWVFWLRLSLFFFVSVPCVIRLPPLLLGLSLIFRPKASSCFCFSPLFFPLCYSSSTPSLFPVFFLLSLLWVDFFRQLPSCCWGPPSGFCLSLCSRFFIQNPPLELGFFSLL